MCPTRAPTFKGPNYRTEAQRRKDSDAARGSRAARGYDAAWQRLRKAYLVEHPWCHCDECGAGRTRLRVATVVHHRKDIAERPDLRLSWDNLQAMAKPCHDALTQRRRVRR